MIVPCKSFPMTARNPVLSCVLHPVSKEPEAKTAALPSTSEEGGRGRTSPGSRGSHSGARGREGAAGEARRHQGWGRSGQGRGLGGRGQGGRWADRRDPQTNAGTPAENGKEGTDGSSSSRLGTGGVGSRPSRPGVDPPPRRSEGRASQAQRQLFGNLDALRAGDSGAQVPEASGERLRSGMSGAVHSCGNACMCNRRFAENAQLYPSTGFQGLRLDMLAYTPC
jgi:hypothetical protein